MIKAENRRSERPVRRWRVSGILRWLALDKERFTPTLVVWRCPAYLVSDPRNPHSPSARLAWQAEPWRAGIALSVWVHRKR
jgi:hypothetical protein